ncbi:hypothetical protein PENFLA_c053G09807 [Penicillium flavigenum]|uniref:Uncharacterized protein n=1 Tax=Penicillium flavigenum TaxID=254877 RepID=A0A1V6SGL3_9EURO|nr:hypothetical protein PENFLA_c053G09807 [Penicillium flavigenum]
MFISVEVNGKYQDKRHVLNSLYLKLKDYQSIFLTVEDLKLLGVEASQVGISDRQLQFDPCFFRPHSEKVLHKYPIRTPQDIAKLGNSATLDDFVDEAKESSTDEKEQLTIAKSRLKAYYEESACFWCYDNALEVPEYVDSQLTQPRKRNPNDEDYQDWFYLFSLTDLELFDWAKGWKKGDPLPWELFTPNVHWRVHRAYRHWDNGNRAKPHCILEIVSDAYASDEDQCLTIHELRAIVNLMLPRVVRGRFRKADIHPHGRIIQASYDGKRLTLQFSQLWSFEREETAPAELFCRYLLSEAVGLQTSTLCVR